MLRRPSSQRRNSAKGEMELPLVPILDTFVTLIAFLLMATSLLAVTLIDTPVPLVSATPPETKEKPLSLTVDVEMDHFEIYSPFGRVKRQRIERKGEDEDFLKLRDALLSIKNDFPFEKQLVLMPGPLVEYEVLVKVMDASREISETDPSLYVKETVKAEDGTESQQDRLVKDLFPEVVFGNILGGA